MKNFGAKRFQLPLQTADFIVAFMVWVILSTLLSVIRTDIELSQGMAAWVIAIPVILGSALRIPFGYLAGKYGARPLYLASFIVLIFPLFFLSEASTAADLIIGGSILGVAGAVFSVGVTSLPRYYPKNRQGFVNGVYGFGNIGTAVTAFGAPVVAQHFGWSLTIKFYIVLMLIMIVLNFFLGDKNEQKIITPITAQFKEIWRDIRLWAYSLFYFITFGAFVAFTIIMPNHFVTHFTLDSVSAGWATGVFIVLAACLRIVGGWLADRSNPNKLLMVVFAGMGIAAIALTLAPNLPVFLTALYAISVFCGLGNGIVFKLVPYTFPNQVGTANGIVAMIGGFGGFFPPHVLAFFFEKTNSSAPGFALYVFFIVICLVLAFVLVKQQANNKLD
ncbi:MAG: MFS transporter [Coriobacteriales bacterium]|jgi:NNP family nitrate/nitrite transporter-like MFS transporter|nr:MFS transporter [Coriobacteriales bacterium]